MTSLKKTKDINRVFKAGRGFKEAGADGKSFQEIEEAMKKLLQKAELIRP